MAALNLKANPEFEVYGNGADLVVEIALTIHASPMGVSERAPISLTAVLDRSGSMAGSKIHMVLETSKFMIRQTSSCDRLSIVTYDTEVLLGLFVGFLCVKLSQGCSKVCLIVGVGFND